MSSEQKLVGALCDCPWTYLEYVTEGIKVWNKGLAFEGRLVCRNCRRWTEAATADGILLEAIQGLYKTLQHELDELKAKLPCERCEGVGNLSEELSCMTCPDCRGSGSLVPKETEDKENADDDA